MRRSSAVAMVCVGSALACTSDPDPSSSESIEVSPEKPEPDPSPTAEPESGGPPIGAWVVIDERQPLRKRGGRIPRIEHLEPAHGLRVAEVVGVEPRLVQLRTIASPVGRACAGTMGFERNYELRFLATLDVLHPVLARPKRVEFDDGTRLELEAGVPVIETGVEGRIQIGKTQLVVNLADEDVARWWLPAVPDETPRTPLPDRREPNIELHYGERSFVAEWPPFHESYGQQEITGGRLLTFDDLCGRFVLRAGPEGVKFDKPMGRTAMEVPQMVGQFDPDRAAEKAGILTSPYGSLDGCVPPTWTAVAGTELSWAEGGEAGSVLVTHTLPSRAVLRDGRVCFVVSDLDVCLDPAKLERKGDVECKSLAGKPTGKVYPKLFEASDGLPEILVRRLVVAHLDEVRSCYEAGLGKNPTLDGRVEIAFSIDAEGKVASSSVHSTPLAFAEAKVPECIAEAVESWSFPKPSAGKIVRVVFPFELSRG